MLRNYNMFSFKVTYDHTHYTSSDISGESVQHDQHIDEVRKVIATDKRIALAYLQSQIEYRNNTARNVKYELVNTEKCPEIVIVEPY